MKKTNHYFLLAGLSLALLAGFSSCKDDDLASDSHYKPPVFLKGNAYEALQQEGDYSIFCRGIELSDYFEIVNGKSIVTVMAPTNAAFNAFLVEKGYSSIDELNAVDHAYLNKLIGYHLMYYSYDWDKMVNFRPNDGDGASEEDKQVLAGFYYKHRTHCSDPIESATVKLTANATSTTDIMIYHNERYLPVFSNKLFESKQIDPAYNYTYFFPNTQWKNNNGGGVFNVANAMVLDNAGNVTDNGYLYHVDHVIEPLNTIYDEMRYNPEYSKFLAIYDTYSVYEPASDEVNSSLGYQAYMHSHQYEKSGDLPQIAWEWPVNSWQSVSTLESYAYTLFAPTNKAIDDLFSKFWTAEGGYATVEDLDPLIMKYFVMQSFADERYLVFPEEITKGNIKTSLGSPVTVDPSTVTDRKMCCNGILYGMENMEMPAVFSSILGPAFSDSRFRPYLYCIDASKLKLSFASSETSYVALMPTEQQMFDTDPSMKLEVTTSGTQLQQFKSETDAYVAMGDGDKSNIVNMHMAQNVDKLPETGTAVIQSMASFNYWFVKDGKIATSARFNNKLNPDYTGEDAFVAFHRIDNKTSNNGAWSNGNAYYYDSKAIFEKTADDGLGRLFLNGNDKRLPYYIFAQLLNKAGLIDTEKKGLSTVLANEGGRFVVFVPTNDVLKAKLKTLPGCANLKINADGELEGKVDEDTQKPQLTKFLMQHFFNTLFNNFTDYPYLGSACNGEFMTVAGSSMRITDTGSTLTIGLVGSTSKPVNVVADYDYFPFAFSDGCLQFIDGYLQ